MAMNIKFWGVRGSIPSPGPETARVGGNTSCVEVTVNGSKLILDAGTGLRKLGNKLLESGAVDVTVLLSHVHWDHIQGIPFFTPIYVPGTRIHMVSGQNACPLRDTLRRQMTTPNFPVDLNDVPAELSFHELKDRQSVILGDARVTIAKANHPDAVYAYRIEHRGHVVVYATDTEHYSCVDHRLVQLARDADVLIYDAQYLPEEYSGQKGMSRVGWGHSTYEAGVALAREARVGQLVLFHHDPTRTDEAVAEIENRAREGFENTCAAREGLSIDVGATSRSQAA